MVLLQISFDLSDKNYGKLGQLDSPIIEMIFPRTKAKELDQLPGLKWKLWTIQPNECRASGLYLFETRMDAESHAAYAQKNYPNVPGLSNISTEFYDVMESLSRITRAPIDLPANPSVGQ